MPNKNYQRGVRLERLWTAEMTDKGYTTTRSAGSHGLIDCFAWNDKEIVLVQIKNGKKAYNDNDIKELKAMPRPKRAKVFLVVRNRPGWDWIPC